MIRALGLPEARAAGALRLALGRSTSRQDVERAAEILGSAVATLTGSNAATGAAAPDKVVTVACKGELDVESSDAYSLAP